MDKEKFFSAITMLFVSKGKPQPTSAEVNVWENLLNEFEDEKIYTGIMAVVKKKTMGLQIADVIEEIEGKSDIEASMDFDRIVQEIYHYGYYQLDKVNTEYLTASELATYATTESNYERKEIKDRFIQRYQENKRIERKRLGGNNGTPKLFQIPE